MMAYNESEALGLVKARLSRTSAATPLDAYLTARIRAAAQELERKGIALREDSADDTMLLVDLTVWRYQSRDKPGAEPDWLRARIRERWMHIDS